MGYFCNFRLRHNVMLELKVRQFHQNKNCRIGEHRNRCQSCACNPGCREWYERHHEHMREIDPNETWCRIVGKAQQMMMIQPDDRDELVAHYVAQRSRP